MNDDRKSIARKLRSESTTAEAILWRELRARQIRGRKWRRQQPIDHYVVDFFCPQLRIIIEVDGDVHADRQDQDNIRQAYLESRGFHVIRFTNEDVLKNLDGVLQTIWELSERRQPPHPNPLPPGERGKFCKI